MESWRVEEDTHIDRRLNTTWTNGEVSAAVWVLPEYPLEFSVAIKTKQQGVTRGTWFSKGGTRCPCTLKLKKSLPWIGLRGQLLNILASRALGLQIFLLLVLISHNYWFLIGFELLWHHGKNLLFTFFSTFRYREKRWKHFLLNSLVCVESYL